jgi:hypothetical protein
VDHADLDALSSNDKGTAAADSPFYSHGFWRRGWCGTVGPSVADTGLFDWGQRVGQARQQDTIVDELEQATVEAHGHTAAGELVADGALPTGQADLAVGRIGAGRQRSNLLTCRCE